MKSKTIQIRNDWLFNEVNYTWAKGPVACLTSESQVD